MRGSLSVSVTASGRGRGLLVCADSEFVSGVECLGCALSRPFPNSTKTSYVNETFVKHTRALLELVARRYPQLLSLGLHGSKEYSRCCFKTNRPLDRTQSPTQPPKLQTPP